MSRHALLASVVLVCLSLLSPSVRVTAQENGPVRNQFVYHQLTNFDATLPFIGAPVLSADGTTGAFYRPYNQEDEAPRNRVYVLHLNNGGVEEIAAIEPPCGCDLATSISEDGSVVAFHDGVGLYVWDSGTLEQVVELAGNEMAALQITADGTTIFFSIWRDSSTIDGDALSKGIWAVDVDGGNLRQVVGADDVFAVVGASETVPGPTFASDGSPLGVSADGEHLVFGAWGPDGEYLFTVDGEGADLAVISGPHSWVYRVAISADGGTIAAQVHDNATGLAPIVTGEYGGEVAPLDLVLGYDFFSRLQLDETGEQLLIDPLGYLVDLESGDITLLVVPGAGGTHEGVLTDGLPAASMNATGTRFLYAIQYVTCADCANLQDQLAVLDLSPSDAGIVPEFSDLTIDVDDEGYLVISMTSDDVYGIYAAALIDGWELDSQIGGRVFLHDDGLDADEVEGDSVFTSRQINLTARPGAAEPGPRTLRIGVEFVGTDGLHHAVAWDAAELTVE